MAIFLGGGGSSSESVHLDREFARRVGDGRLVYWPFAMRHERTPQECETWLRATFEPLGLSRIDTWSSLAGRDPGELQTAAGLYIGGGNTFRLLHELQEARVQEPLSELVGHLAIYGGSAGAAVLGETIETISHLDENDIGLRDLTALRLLGGASVWVHHEPADRARIDHFIDDSQRTVIALAIDGGAIIEGSMITSVGFSTVRFIRAGVDIELPPGASLNTAGIG